MNLRPSFFQYNPSHFDNQPASKRQARYSCAQKIGKFITEPLRKGDKSHPLRWRMGMRLNHIHNDLHSKHPKLWNAIVMTARTLICKPFGHRWTRFEAVKYGDFGDSRICKLCRISHGQHRGVDSYHETHRQGGWNKIAKP